MTASLDARLNRREALKLLGVATTSGLLASCGGSSTTTSTSTGTGTSSSDGTCTVTPEGEEGPYFVDDSASGYLRSDIRSNLDGSSVQAGIPLTLTITVYDTQNSCALMSVFKWTSGTAMPKDFIPRSKSSRRPIRSGCAVIR